MTIFKNINDNLLYILYKNVNGSYVAIPYEHKGKSITNCNPKEFIPVKTSDTQKFCDFIRFKSVTKVYLREDK